jgi:hypothetical protein
MVSSFGISVILLLLGKQGLQISTHAALLITIGATTISWIATAWIGPQTDQDVLMAFYRKVRPVGPGWEPVRLAAGLPRRTVRDDNIPLALLGWAAGCMTIWSALFTVGNFLYQRTVPALVLLSVFVVSGLILLRVIRTLWYSRDPVTAS